MSTPEASEAWLEVGRRVYGYSLAVVATRRSLNEQDAEDLAGGIMLRLQDLNLVRRMLRVGVPAGYFYAMLRNAANDLWKRRQFQQTPLDEAGLTTILDQAFDAGVERSVLVQRLQAEIACLSPDEQRLLELRFDRRLKLREIADALGVSFSAAAVRLHRLLRRLRSRLEVGD